MGYEKSVNRPSARPGNWHRAALVAVAASLAFALVAWALPVWQPQEGRELIGTKAPEFRGLAWLSGGPLTVAGLRGRVVLIRFWLIDCSLCAATAPALTDLHARFKDKGLVIIGIHHPKSAAARRFDKVKSSAAKLGFRFPIAVDNGWQTINAYWLGGRRRSYTSATFLIDKQGVIQWVHDGGEFHSAGGRRHENCAKAYASLEEKINRLIQ